MGIKTVAAHGDGRLAITTFGKGNTAEIALSTDAKGSNLHMPCQAGRLTIRDIDKDIDLERGALAAIIDNPADAECVREDYLGLKATLEKEFFGREFPNDNIRIQIIHNILDILKIIGLYVNDIIYCINNLQDCDNPEDIVGLSMGQEKVREKLKTIRPYLGFFGDAFQLPPKKKTNSSNFGKKSSTQMRPDEKHNIAVLRILGRARQFTAHYKDSTIFFKNYDGLIKQFQDEWSIVARIYKKRIDNVNNSFMEHSAMNLRILFDMFGATSVDEQTNIVEQYYNFSIRKDGKNLGLNMRKLRELVVDTFYPEIKNKKHDSYRHKIYVIMDYVLYRLLDKTEELNEMVARLRETPDDQAKDTLYRLFAQVAWDKTSATLVPFFQKYDGNFPVFETDTKIPALGAKIWLKSEGAVDEGDPVPFVQFLAFLCNFMDAKEINELLTAFINKFESIQDFINILTGLEKTQKEKTPVKFVDNYKMFNEMGSKMAGQIARQLRILASVGKMKPDLNDAKRQLYKAAILTLGIADHSEWIDDKWLEENILLDGTAPKATKDRVNPFRNFIAGNVISSRRFMYLVRYTKPHAVRELMQNREIVRYVLTRLPETQIKSYYDSFFKANNGNEPLESMIESLTTKLTGLSFASLVENRNGIVENSKKSPTHKNIEIERLKILVGLYLTVAFVAIKNLIKINARYYIAFSVFERDYAMFVKKDPAGIEPLAIPLGEQAKNEAFAITKYFLKLEDDNDYHPEPGQPFDRIACRKHLDSIKRHFDKKWRDIFHKQIDEALAMSPTGWLPVSARNHAEHLNVVMRALPRFIKGFRARVRGQRMQSYFELYHYLLQKMMVEGDDKDKNKDKDRINLTIPNDYLKYVEVGIPCNDWIKIMYVGLGYNLPRYKNLTTEALFDKDSVSGQTNTQRKESKS